MVNENTGRALLKRCFEKAGLSIREGYRLSDDGVDIELDGFDPDRRVGYEYITSEAGDRASITPAVVAELEARMTRGELHLLLLDEIEAVDESDIAFAAERFLEAWHERGAPRS